MALFLGGTVPFAAACEDHDVPFHLWPEVLATMIDGDAGGVWLHAATGIEHVDREGARTAHLQARTDPQAFLRLDDGRFLVSQNRTLRSLGADGASPVAPWGILPAFGPDGTLHYVAIGTNGVMRMAPETRSEEPLFSNSSAHIRQLAFSPAGDLHVAVGGGVARFDANTSTLVPVHQRNGTIGDPAIAFDAQGRLLVVESVYNATMRMHIMELSRVDDGGATRLATVHDARHLYASVGGDRLYVSVSSPGCAPAGTYCLGYFQLGAPAFEGFPAVLQQPPAPDLAVTSILVEREPPMVHDAIPVSVDVDEVRKIHVTVTNVGDGPAVGRWPLYLDAREDSTVALATRVPSGYPWWGSGYDGTLAPGESRTFTFEWNVTRYAGEFTLTAMVDEGGWRHLPEVDEHGNNRMQESTVIRTTL